MRKINPSPFKPILIVAVLFFGPFSYGSAQSGADEDEAPLQVIFPGSGIRFSEKATGRIKLTVRDTKGNITPCLVSLEQTPGGENVSLPHEFGMTADGSNRAQWKGKNPVRSRGVYKQSLPPGKYRLTIGKGVEYIPEIREFTVDDSETVSLTVDLKYFRKMSALGWWSGDDHVHSTRMLGIDPDFLSLAECEDIHFTNVLQMGPWYELGTQMDGDELPDWETNVFGENREKNHRGNYWLIQGQEHPRTPYFGHVIMLNLDTFIIHEDEYYVYDKVWQETRDLGAVTGYAHFYKKVDPRWGPVPGHVTQFAEGRVDFVEIVDNNYLDDPSLYYEMLNMGFMIPATGGTDYPYGLELGDNRTFVYVDPQKPITPYLWTEGIREGRTFVTQGPLLEFVVNGKMIASVIHVNKGDTIHIRAVGMGHPMVGSPSSVSLISMGKEIKKVESDDINQDSLVLYHSLTIDKSMWFAVHIDAHIGGFAHSSPIYVIVDNKRAIDTETVDGLVQDRLGKVEILRSRIENVPENQRAKLLLSFDRAELFWRAMPDILPDIPYEH